MFGEAYGPISGSGGMFACTRRTNGCKVASITRRQHAVGSRAAPWSGPCFFVRQPWRPAPCLSLLTRPWRGGWALSNAFAVSSNGDGEAAKMYALVDIGMGGQFIDRIPIGTILFPRRDDHSGHRYIPTLGRAFCS